MSTIACTEKHTTFQPTDEQWKCPKCGARNESPGNRAFFVDDESPSMDRNLLHMDCDLLHEEDQIICTGCDSSWTGKRLAVVMSKALGLEKCPYCKGAGFVKKEVAE